MMTAESLAKLIAAMPDRVAAEKNRMLTESLPVTPKGILEQFTKAAEFAKTLPDWAREEAGLTPINRTIVLRLPYPVSTNRIKRYVSQEVRNFKTEAGLIARQAFSAPLPGDVSLKMVLHPRQPKRDQGKPLRLMDLDNAIKVSLDSLNGIAWLDDKQVTAIHIRRGDPVDGGALVVEIREASAE